MQENDPCLWKSCTCMFTRVGYHAKKISICDFLKKWESTVKYHNQGQFCEGVEKCIYCLCNFSLGLNLPPNQEKAG